MQTEQISASTIKYDRKDNQEFYEVFRKRVDNYFKNKGISKYGDWRIRLKIFTLLAIFFSSYILMYLESNTPGIVLLLASICGLTGIMIALNVIHDASHNALFRKRKWNELLLYSMNLLGSTGYLYRLNHVKIHHNFPNVIGIDADLNQPNPFLRLSPGAPKYKIHRFQHLYAPFIYRSCLKFRL